MKRIFCFGELLLRISPRLERKWIEDAQVAIFIGGAELNTARALAQWQHYVAYCTALPDNYLANEIIESINKIGVHTNTVKYFGNRIGLYYLPEGADLKNAGVIYDRAGSAFANLKPGMIDWKNVLKDFDWFNWSAISPALSKDIATVCKEAVIAAKQMGLTVSVDLNYRSKLWQYGVRPFNVMPELVSYADIIMGNIWSANQLLNLGVKTDASYAKGKEYCMDAAALTAEKIFSQYKHCQQIANTFRFTEEAIYYFATLHQVKNHTVSETFQTNNTKDKVGSGDTFMAGLIHGMINQWTQTEIINFAASAAFGKLQETGDFTKQSIEIIKSRYRNG